MCLLAAGMASAAGANGSSNGAAPRAAPAKATRGYKQPPKEILDIVDAPAQPALTFSPDRSQILQLTRPPALPPIFDISRPELKLAGVCAAFVRVCVCVCVLSGAQHHAASTAFTRAACHAP